MIETFILEMIYAFKSLSYFGITLALTFEFIPAELVLPLVGYWVYQGDMNLYLAILAGTIGGVTGPLTLYALGRYGGRPLANKYGKYFLVREKELDAADRFFEKYGAGVAFFARFMPVVRTAISIPCGIAKMNVYKFSIYTFLAMLPITSLYIYVGYLLGPNWEEAGHVVARYLEPIVIVLLVLLIIFIGYKIYQKRAAKKSL
ncbi:DedA family protein [Halalkalibacterium ligniniphilum]|uniref:DedA family protein n=1 Tax=Halalkalibacterium ligniniphilum TaxID=1134413 RepID=UPI0003481BB1|nr:VTT domain-containing protein [Halalkalibacterium ligniniphilum]